MTQTKRQKKRLAAAQWFHDMFGKDKRTKKTVDQMMKQAKAKDRRIEKGKSK